MTVQRLAEVLKAASEAHHEYEQSKMFGKTDANWHEWYARYIAAHHPELIATCYSNSIDANKDRLGFLGEYVGSVAKPHIGEHDYSKG